MSDITTLLHQAIDLSDAGKYKKAHDLFTKVIALDPANAQAYYERARTFLERNKDAEALPDLNKCLELDPAYPGGYRVRAGVHKVMGNLALAAQDQFQEIKLSTSKPDEIMGASPHTWTDCLETFVKLGDIPSALAVMEDFLINGKPNVTKHVRDITWANVVFARLMLKVGQNDRALSFAQDAYNVQPEYSLPVTLGVYGLALEATGQKENAGKILKETLKRYGESEETHRLKAKLTGVTPVQHPGDKPAKKAIELAYGGEKDKAFQLAEKLVAQYPDFAPAFHARAVARRLNDDSTNALIDLEKCLQLDPSLKAAAWERTYAFQSLGDLKSAAREQDALLRQEVGDMEEPPDPSTWFGSAELHEEAGDPQAALALYDFYFTHRVEDVEDMGVSDNYDPRIEFARLLAMHGQGARAIPFALLYANASGSAKRRARWKAILGLAYLAAGELEKAAATLKEAKKLDKTNPEANELEKHLTEAQAAAPAPEKTTKKKKN